MGRFLAGVPAIVLAACIFTSALASGQGDRYLAVVQFPQGRELTRTELGEETGFSLSFIHSVSRTPVTDIYRIQGTRIIQTQERFRAHGAGLPSHPSEPGGLSWAKEGEEFVLNMERPIPKLVVRTDKNYKNRLILGSTTINLNQWEDQALLLRIVGN
ncbi:MAG: DUF1850 domain-containing protein [Desulfobacter sp.]|nr:MAG: DUF1850 domain-containing protein [Desulfobacter sp.]